MGEHVWREGIGNWRFAIAQSMAIAMNIQRNIVIALPCVSKGRIAPCTAKGSIPMADLFRVHRAPVSVIPFHTAILHLQSKNESIICYKEYDTKVAALNWERVTLSFEWLDDCKFVEWFRNMIKNTPKHLYVSQFERQGFLKCLNQQEQDLVKALMATDGMWQIGDKARSIVDEFLTSQFGSTTARYIAVNWRVELLPWERLVPCAKSLLKNMHSVAVSEPKAKISPLLRTSPLFDHSNVPLLLISDLPFVGERFWIQGAGNSTIYGPVIQLLKSTGFVKLDEWAAEMEYESTFLMLADMILAERSTLFITGVMTLQPSQSNHCAPNRFFNKWMYELAAHHPNTTACVNWLDHGTKDCQIVDVSRSFPHPRVIQ